MISSKPSKQPNQAPSWFKFSLRKIKNQYKSSSVLMGHYLIVLLHDNTLEESDIQGYYELKNSLFSEPDFEPAILLAVDLRDRSVQEANIPADLFFTEKKLTLLKSKDNEVIIIGGEEFSASYLLVIRVTVESFQPFSVRIQKIESESEDCPPILMSHTAQISQNCLYAYGVGRDERENNVAQLWSFDLSNPVWNSCEIGEQGPGMRKRSSSFVLKDHLYIYGGQKVPDHFGYRQNYREEGQESEESEEEEEDDDEEEDPSRFKDIFMLDLKSMNWTRLEQKETYLMHKIDDFRRKKLDIALYKGYLLVLGDGRTEKNSTKESLCCWNIEKNSWSVLDVQRNKVHSKARDLTVYNNLLVCSGPTSDGDFALSMLNLEDVGLSVPETAEQKRFKALFLSEEESDIKFKVQDKIIPAHKQVLTEKSEYFANLFNSGMADSKQEIIEISNCDYPIFQEFLRFLYREEVQLDESLVLNLLAFADRYVQSDLIAKCMDFLKYNTNVENVFTTLDFARQENIAHLKDWCLTFLTNKIDISNISGLVTFLNKQNDPENIPLRDLAINVIINKFTEIPQDQKVAPNFYEDFLINNIAFDTVLTLVNFISGHNYKRKDSHWDKSKGFSSQPVSRVDVHVDKALATQEKEILEPEIKNLRTALNNFVWTNLKTLKENKIAKGLPSTFLTGLLGVVIEKQQEKVNILA